MAFTNNLLRLLKTPPPQADESLMGYILRLTEENAYLSPSWIFDLAGLKVDVRKGGWSTLYREDFDSLALRKITGLERSEFEGLRYHLMAYDKAATFRTKQVPVSSIKRNSPKVCPACLREANYYRSVWDLLPFTICPAHRLILIDKCPGCGDTISWVRKKVSVCPCAFDWRDFIPSQATSYELAHVQLILQHCDAASDKNFIRVNKENPLDDLNLNDLCLALHIIAHHFLMKEGHRIAATTENVLCHKAYSNAFSTFENWPVNFNNFFSRFEQQNKESWNSYENQRHLYKWCDQGELSFIILAYEDFLEKRTENGSDDLNSVSIFRRFISIKEACQRLSITRYQLEDLIAQGKLDVLQRRDGDKDILVDAKSLVDFRTWLNNLASILVIAQNLEINIIDVEDLIYHGCLTPLSGPPLDGLLEWRFQIQAGHDLIKNIRYRLVRIVPGTSEQLVNANNVIRKMKACGLSAGQFVRAVLEGKIIPRKEIPHHGLSSFFFSQDEITEYIRSCQPTRNECCIDYRRAAAFLAVRKEVTGQIFTKKKKDNREFKDYGEEEYDLSLLVRLAKLTCTLKIISVDSLDSSE